MKKVVDLLTETVKEGVATREDIYELRTEAKEETNGLREEITRLIAEMKEEINRLEKEILNLERKGDRNLYILIIVLIILNGDKVLQFLSLFIK